MKKYFLFLLICVPFISGCATVNPNSYIWDTWYNQIFYNNYEIEFISNPPGAKIEFNNTYIGDAPLIQKLNGYQSGTTVITAIPIYPNQYTQTKTIRSNQAVPRRMYFDMNLYPIEKDINININ